MMEGIIGGVVGATVVALVCKGKWRNDIQKEGVFGRIVCDSLQVGDVKVEDRFSEGTITCSRLLVGGEQCDGFILVCDEDGKGRVRLGTGGSSLSNGGGYVRIYGDNDRTVEMVADQLQEKIRIGSDMGDRGCVALEVYEGRGEVRVWGSTESACR